MAAAVAMAAAAAVLEAATALDVVGQLELRPVVAAADATCRAIGIVATSVAVG